MSASIPNWSGGGLPICISLNPLLTSLHQMIEPSRARVIWSPMFAFSSRSDRCPKMMRGYRFSRSTLRDTLSTIAFCSSSTYDIIGNPYNDSSERSNFSAWYGKPCCTKYEPVCSNSPVIIISPVNGSGCITGSCSKNGCGISSMGCSTPSAKTMRLRCTRSCISYNNANSPNSLACVIEFSSSESV